MQIAIFVGADGGLAGPGFRQHQETQGARCKIVAHFNQLLYRTLKEPVPVQFQQQNRIKEFECLSLAGEPPCNVMLG